MQLLAKNILPEKFWIIENFENAKLGTIQVAPAAVRVVLNGNKYIYSDFVSALEEHNISTSTDPIGKQDLAEAIEYHMDGYPTKDKPFNGVYDAKMGFNMYTKTEKSSCFYAAGYYIIRFDFAWAQAFSPKVMTLKRNEFRGPYKSELEMKEQLRLHNGKDKN
jgi:hypothetical protein